MSEISENSNERFIHYSIKFAAFEIFYLSIKLEGGTLSESNHYMTSSLIHLSKESFIHSKKCARFFRTKSCLWIL